MFYIELKPENNNKDTSIVRSFLQCKIKFDHTQNVKFFNTELLAIWPHEKFCFCFHKARYIKCAEDHLTSNYSRKEKSKDVKCLLREGNYSANYKGYMFYKDLKKIFFCIRKIFGEKVWRKVITHKPQLQTKFTSKLR